MKIFITASKEYQSYVDTSTTGVSYYDDFLNDEGLNYLRSHKNRTGKVVMMSPTEYFNECANRVFDSTFDSLVKQRRHDKDTLEWMYDQIDQGVELKLPYINYADGGQEGLHRMMALGDKLGWDSRFPVLTVEIYDNRKEDVDSVYKYLRRSVDEAVKYQYPEDNLIEYFKSQLGFEMESLSEYDDDAPDLNIVVYIEDEILYVTAEGYEDDISIDIPISDMRISEPSDSDDIDDIIEGLSDEELESYLDGYFD